MTKEHNHEETAFPCAPENASIDCCQSTNGKSPCCDPGKGRDWPKWKSLVSAIVILADAGVGANTIIKANSAQAGSSNSFSSFLNEKSEKSENSKAAQQADGSLFSFNRVMDSL